MGERMKKYVCLLCERSIPGTEGCHDDLEDEAMALGADGVCDRCWVEWTAYRESAEVIGRWQP